MVLVVEIVVVAVIVFVVAALAVGWFDRMSPAPPDAAPTGLPDQGPVTADSVRGVRLNLAFRGYRMAEVDALLSRLAGEIAWRDEEIARRDEELVRLATFAYADTSEATPGTGGLSAPPAPPAAGPARPDGAADGWSSPT